MTTIGMIGLGTMGGPMALNLLKAGYPVTVYNRSLDKTLSLRENGAHVATNPAELTRSVDVIITMLSDDHAVREVYYGENGILEGIRPDQTVMDCSTISPDLSRKIYQSLSELFVDFLDSPVTGSKPAAINGELVFMIGGEYSVFEKQLPIFEILGSKALYMGPSGAGSQTKLAHNTITAINLAALAEGMSIATKAGVDPEKFLDIVKAGTASSKVAEVKGEKILDRDFTNQFAVKLMLKDLNLSSELTSSLGMPAPMLQNAINIYRIAANKGLGDEDTSAIVHCYEEWIGRTITRPIHLQSSHEAQSSSNRRRSVRLPVGIDLQLSVYQWEQEGAFAGQILKGKLYDLSEQGMQISCESPLAQDMFIIIHFPKDANLPPITARIIRIDAVDGTYRYGCIISGIALHTQRKLEQYIHYRQSLYEQPSS